MRYINRRFTYLLPDLPRQQPARNFFSVTCVIKQKIYRAPKSIEESANNNNSYYYKHNHLTAVYLGKPGTRTKGKEVKYPSS